MSVKLILGRPGAGKSYEAVCYYVLPALKAGRHVVTNLPLNLDRLSALDPSYYSLVHINVGTPEAAPFRFVEDYTSKQDLKNIDTGQSPIFIIDEAHKSIPAGAGKTSDAVIKWFAEHRHAGVDVVLITQDARKLHRYITSLVDDVIVCTKNRVFGSSSSYRRRIKDGLGGDYIGDAQVRRYKKQYYALYQSYTQGGDKEVELSRVPTLFKQPVFFFMAFLLLGCAYLYFNKGQFTEKKLSETAIAARQKRLPPPVQPLPVSNNVPLSSSPQSSIISVKPLDVLEARIPMLISSGSSEVVYVSIRDSNGDVTRHTSDGLLALGYSSRKLSDGSMSFSSSVGHTFVAYIGRHSPLPYELQLKRRNLNSMASRSGVPNYDGNAFGFTKKVFNETLGEENNAISDAKSHPSGDVSK